ncbi:MAG: D-2-hydroxyacid dehydrogenase [Acidobacteria bacterium]|nr:D-2-hydroxyacid dehydrogenase [Acidobacteriota bacterium]
MLVYTPWPVPFWQIPQSQVSRLRERFPEVSFVQPQSETEALREVVDVEIALSSRLNAQMVQRAARLRWVHSTAASVGTLALDDLAARGIAVTNSRGIQAIAMAEHVMGGLLVLARRLDATLAAQRERRWIQNELSGDMWPWRLHGRSMTILGLGTIGQEVARRAHAFGMRVTGIRRRAGRPKPPFVERMLGPDQLDDALHGCDVLVLSAPAVPETERLIGAERIALLNRGAIIVNVARGRIVVESAMIDALQTGRLGGAVLDVFDREPLPEASPLWTLPNVVITPHSSGFRADHWQDSIDLFSDNLRRYQLGEPLLNVVDPKAGY